MIVDIITKSTSFGLRVISYKVKIGIDSILNIEAIPLSMLYAVYYGDAVYYGETEKYIVNSIAYTKIFSKHSMETDNDFLNVCLSYNEII